MNFFCLYWLLFLFVNEEMSAKTLGVSLPAPSSVELQYQPSSKYVPPMIAKEEYTFSRLLEIALFCSNRANKPTCNTFACIL